jgi:hypothetical protein
MSLAQNGEQFHVRLENGETLIGDLAVIRPATKGRAAGAVRDRSVERSSLPRRSMGYRASKRDQEGWRVMLLSGLTAADVAASILREATRASMSSPERYTVDLAPAVTNR